MGNFKINFGLLGVNHGAMCRQSFRLSYVFLEVGLCREFLLDCVPFIYSFHLIVLIRLLLILIRFVATETLKKEPFLSCFSSLANLQGKLNRKKSNQIL